jgi:hypothetical protein
MRHYDGGIVTRPAHGINPTRSIFLDILTGRVRLFRLYRL